MRPLPFDASHYGAYFIYWGCRLKISIALNPKKNVTIVINSGQMSTSLRVVGSGFGPYHRLVHANAPTECAAVTPTTWAMSLTLGFGTILLGGK